MSSNDRPIIIKKVTKGGGDGHHGGAWKVAYADFVTAMMAFFLLMWLLNATTEKQRKGIADFFDPSIPLARISAGGSEMLNGDSVTAEQKRPGSDEPTPKAADSSALMQHRSSKTSPQGAPAETPPEEPAEDAELAEGAAELFAAAYKAEETRLEALAEGVRAAVAAAGGELDEHFLVRMTPEGLVIEIVDTGSQPLFASGSAEPSPKLAELMQVIVPLLGLATNPIAVVGHTDASPFSRGGSDNWTLSAGRANSARRLMLAFGLGERRIAQVTGRAATQPLSDDPTAPENRRIALTLLRQRPR